MKHYQIQIRNLCPNESEFNQILEIENMSFTVDAYTVEQFKDWYEKCPELSIVAEISGKIAGYMMTCILPEGGDIVSIAVHPDYRRKGIAKALFDYTSGYLKEQGLSQVRLEVKRTNFEGLRFWEDTGFEVVGIEPNYYRDGAEALVMRKRI